MSTETTHHRGPTTVGIVPNDSAVQTVDEDGVVADVHRPTGTPRAVVVLAHGAGGNRDAVILRAFADELCARGFVVAQPASICPTGNAAPRGHRVRRPRPQTATASAPRARTSVVSPTAR